MASLQGKHSIWKGKSLSNACAYLRKRKTKCLNSLTIKGKAPSKYCFEILDRRSSVSLSNLTAVFCSVDWINRFWLRWKATLPTEKRNKIRSAHTASWWWGYLGFLTTGINTDALNSNLHNTWVFTTIICVACAQEQEHTKWTLYKSEKCDFESKSVLGVCVDELAVGT